MKDGQLKLINYMWRKCLNSHNGKALFNSKYIAERFLGEKSNHQYLDATLRDLSDIKIRFFNIEGVSDKILEASINSIYCTEEYRELTRMLAGEPTMRSQSMSEEEVVAFKKDFFADLLQGLAK
jgi:hypothetical protein